MTKTEFIEGLSRSLMGKVDENEYRKQMDYYSRYIDDEIASGKNEKEVVESLGEPRFIAKTIVQTYVMKDDPIRNQYRENIYNERYGERYEEDYEEEKNGSRLASKAHKVLYIAVSIIVLLIICAVVFNILAVLLPIIIVFVVICVIMRIFRS